MSLARAEKFSQELVTDANAARRSVLGCFGPCRCLERRSLSPRSSEVWGDTTPRDSPMA
jgi:hypothetical protein